MKLTWYPACCVISRSAFSWRLTRMRSLSPSSQRMWAIGTPHLSLRRPLSEMRFS